MTGIDHDVVVRRLATMRTLLDHLSTLDVDGPMALDDLAVRLQVERVLTQLVNLAAEINAHVAAAALNRPPEDYREGFDRMVDAGFLDRGTAASLKPSVGLRNVLTHEYVRVDVGLVAQAIAPALSGYGQYVRMVASALARHHVRRGAQRVALLSPAPPAEGRRDIWGDLSGAIRADFDEPLPDFGDHQ